MSKLDAVVLLTPEEEVARLWRSAREAFERARDSLVALGEALHLGIRVAEILIHHKLQPAKERFAATIGSQLEAPDPGVQSPRDAMAVPAVLQFVDMLDLLSEDGLACVSPHLHRGWEDRRRSCLRSRAVAREAAGTVLDGEARNRLLLLLAYRNRLFRFPPPLRVVTGEVLGALPELAELVEGLAPKRDTRATSGPLER